MRLGDLSRPRSKSSPGKKTVIEASKTAQKNCVFRSFPRLRCSNNASVDHNHDVSDLTKRASPKKSRCLDRKAMNPASCATPASSGSVNFSRGRPCFEC